MNKTDTVVLKLTGKHFLNISTEDLLTLKTVVEKKVKQINK